MAGMRSDQTLFEHARRQHEDGEAEARELRARWPELFGGDGKARTEPARASRP